MSETVHETGRLVRVEIVDSLEETCKQILIDNNIKLEFDESFEEQLTYEFYKEYIVRDGVLYKIEYYKRCSNSDDIFEIDKDGNFILQYYNGGCSFYEAIEYAIEKRDKSV